MPVNRARMHFCKFSTAIIYPILFLIFSLILIGCSPKLSTEEEIKKFEQAGPLITGSENGDVEGEIQRGGPYHVLAGDILEFQMPAVLRVVSSDLLEWLRPSQGHNDVESYLARVNDSGMITLPIIGQIDAGGKTLAEIESSVINAYYPKYVVNPPMVVCEVKKYKNENERVFAVLGLVTKPDAFPYPPDVQYNLMEALAFAGGLDLVADPRYVQIYRRDPSGEILAATFSIGNESLTQASNVIIKPGDIIYVEHTLRTRTNRFLSDVLRITVGADARYSD
jgi:protein involved in polysaccharide export with SLBB domain